MYGLKHHIVQEMSQCGTINDEQVKMGLLSQWKLEADFRNWQHLRNSISYQSINGANSDSRGLRKEETIKIILKKSSRAL